MSRPGPDPLADALARLRARPAPPVDVADRVMARVACLPRPARSERRWALGVAASIGALATAVAAFAPALAPIRSVAADATPALVAVVRAVFVAAAAAGEALVRAAGGLDAVRSHAGAAGALALAAGGSFALLLLAREIRRAPALARSPR